MRTRCFLYKCKNLSSSSMSAQRRLDTENLCFFFYAKWVIFKRYTVEHLTLFTPFSGDNKTEIKLLRKCDCKSPKVSRFLLIRNEARPPDN